MEAQRPAQERVPHTPLEEKIARRLGVELEQVPKINLLLHFVDHSTADEAEGLRENLKKADIVLTEWYGAGASEEEFLREVTHGSGLEEAEALHGMYGDQGFEHGFHAQLEGTEKNVLPIDIPATSPIYEEWQKIQRDVAAFDQSTLNDKPPLFADLLQEYASFARRYAVDFQKPRDAYIVSQMPDTLTHALELEPELLKKKELSVVGWFGAFHTGIYHDLKRTEHPSTSRKFSEASATFGSGLWDEPSRMYRFNKEPDPIVLARAWLAAQQGFKDAVASVNATDSGTKQQAREMLGRFTLGDIEAIYNVWRIEKNSDEAEKLMRDRLSDK